jgi:hypothetical protein
MGYFDKEAMDSNLAKYNGMKVIKIGSSDEGDEGVSITFENGDVLVLGWSSCEGFAELNGKEIK